MWRAINDVFEKHKILNRLNARHHFYTATMTASENILTYKNRIRRLGTTLESMGVTLDEEEMAMGVLKGLPSSYDNLVSALDAVCSSGESSSTLNMDLVRSRLLQKEQRMGTRKTTSTPVSDVALVSHSAPSTSR